MQSSCESIVLGDKLAAYAKAFIREVPLDEIRSAGPGGNHLGTPYTWRHCREFWTSELFDDAGYERWASEGSQSLMARAQGS